MDVIIIVGLASSEWKRVGVTIPVSGHAMYQSRMWIQEFHEACGVQTNMTRTAMT